MNLLDDYEDDLLVAHEFGWCSDDCGYCEADLKAGLSANEIAGRKLPVRAQKEQE